ncbi:MAG: hypothetical protein U9P07_12765 [Pseudomonadota bacterium]|nr:hypothetical protein [Pseudomonadota bacterium]
MLSHRHYQLAINNMVNFLSCAKNTCLPTGRAARNFQGCSGIALAHSRRPSMAGCGAR